MHRKIVVLVIALASSTAWAKDFVAPDQIVYDAVPGYGAQGGTDIFEWQRKSAPGAGEPAVPATMDAPHGLRLRWLGTAGFEISDDDTSILVDPFVSRPTAVEAFLFAKLNIDVEAVDKYVTEPMVRSGNLNKLKAILVSHTHHDHVQDVPYILSKFPQVANRPLVAGDKNLVCVLKAYKGREQEIPWLKGIDPLTKGPQKIFKFSEKKMDHPPKNQKLGIPVGTFGKFTITAYIGQHGLYDDIPFNLEGNVNGKAPLTGGEYRAYHNSSMTYLIEYNSGNAKKLRIFATDSARFLNGERVSSEVMQGGPIDILLEGIASRKKENGIPKKIEGFKPTYFVPTHFDNFFIPFDVFRAFDFKIMAPADNSELKPFIEGFCKDTTYCPKLRTMKMFYYYSLQNLLTGSAD
jgi:hypothetical protein